MKWNLPDRRRLGVWFNLATGGVAPADAQQLRSVRVSQAALSALASRVLAVLISIVSVPLTLGYLGLERNGLWLTISTLLTWITLADFGLGNGLTNPLAAAYAHDQREAAQRQVATTFWLQVIISVVLGSIVAVGWRWFDWSSLFNIGSQQARAEIGPALALAVAIALLNFPFALVQKILRAYQESMVADLWLAIGNVGSLLALVLVTQTRGGLVWLVGAFSGSSLLVTIGSAVWLFRRHKPWLAPHPTKVHLASTRQLGVTGGLFFIVQLSGLLVYQSDNVIIAHFVGPQAVTPYNVTWRLFAYTNLLQVAVIGALWPAYAEAFARRDGAWIRRTYRLHLLAGTASAALLTLPLVAFGTTIIGIWAGREAIPPMALLVWMGAWSVVNASMDVAGCMLNGANRLKWQSLYGLGTAVVNILLSLVLVQTYGIVGVIAATVIAYLTCAVVPSLLETAFIIKQLPKH